MRLGVFLKIANQTKLNQTAIRQLGVGQAIEVLDFPDELPRQRNADFYRRSHLDRQHHHQEQIDKTKQMMIRNAGYLTNTNSEHL